MNDNRQMRNSQLLRFSRTAQQISHLLARSTTIRCCCRHRWNTIPHMWNSSIRMPSRPGQKFVPQVKAAGGKFQGLFLLNYMTNSFQNKMLSWIWNPEKFKCNICKCTETMVICPFEMKTTGFKVHQLDPTLVGLN